MYNTIHTIRLTNVPGTNGYCDDAAKSEIRQAICETRQPAISFLGSGNYHYLSYFNLERIEEDFALILIDHHPDIQPPAFGDILSCGGWIYDSLRDLPHLKRVYMIGVDPKLIEELKPLDERVCVLDYRSPISDKHMLGEGSAALPIFISIDKDAMSPSYAACDWDQGDMTLQELMDIVSSLISDYRILGVDICGDKKDSPTTCDDAVNLSTNTELLELLLSVK